jgi:hypothetical protein
MQEKAGALATLFKTVLTFNLPLNHEDILLNDGAVAGAYTRPLFSST